MRVRNIPHTTIYVVRSARKLIVHVIINESQFLAEIHLELKLFDVYNLQLRLAAWFGRIQML